MSFVEPSSIIEKCLVLEDRAYRTYYELSWRHDDPALCSFWRQMSDEEYVHLAFWKEVLPLARDGMIPQIFDRPAEIVDELDHLLGVTEGVRARILAGTDVSAAFSYALHLELHLLHPSFAAFFQFMNTVNGARTPADNYEGHLERFMTAAARYGDNPDLDMLRETTYRLWRQNRELARLSTFDSLTGVMNRRGLALATSSLAHLAQRNGDPVGVLMADIDHFKAVNDRLGHPAGDKVLVAVASAIKSQLRQSDVVGRYGGEEFLVFLPRIDPGTLPALAEKIRAHVADVVLALTPVTISLGGVEGTIAGNPQTALERLVWLADEALYTAKRDGRNRVAFAPTQKAGIALAN